MAYNSVLFAVGNGVSCSHESLSTEERSLKSASCPVSGKSEWRSSKQNPRRKLDGEEKMLCWSIRRFQTISRVLVREPIKRVVPVCGQSMQTRNPSWEPFMWGRGF